MNSSAKRALQILNIVGCSPEPLGLSQIARELAVPLSNVARGVDALERTGFLQRYQASARYVLGESAKNLRQSTLRRFPLRGVAIPFLRQLSFASGETASLVIRVGWYAVKIAAVTGYNDLIGIRPTIAEPVLANAAGRIIIAMERAETVAAFLARSTHGVTDLVNRELSEARSRGFALLASGFQPDHAVIAFPVMGDIEPLGAIMIEGPVVRLDDLEPRDEVERWKKVVAELSTIVRDRPDLASNPFASIDPDVIHLS